ncbi:sugar diacid recognition domain-containing protein [Mesobacillus sp. AQ2]|uniref:sugar diacid recognition domain-containing protein n=1 Tax=Mesobacillus sp. AQ2 TaxID=3043332 RepID=UPI0024C19EE0|nr:sugar diacid recognition domain-containing protein [Mesobacillus sp. AQ2]WHX38586.1 sugar diacid recognition domain-containing protein [Mesobacillus sp. AQ2]
MDFLDKQLAQEIVDRTMGIIGKNINVMDNRGVIIGSGDQKRIDDIHEGAVNVIKQGSGYEITEKEAKNLHGVKAGINLPIRFDGEIVGVIGITGSPEEIRSFGELVRMAAELSLQQAVLMNEIQWDERLKEELVSQIIHSQGKMDPLFLERAMRLGINLDLPRIAMVILSSDRKKTFTFLKGRLEKDDLLLMQHDRIVILKRMPSAQSANQVRKLAEGWVDSYKSTSDVYIKIGIGQQHPGLTGLAMSYQQAEHTLKAGQKLAPDKDIFVYEDYYLPVFLLTASNMGLTEGLEPYYTRLKARDTKGELTESLRALIDTNGDMNSAAKMLFIHRNTLRYRLDKITEITGKDPRKTTDLLHLYLSFLNNELE